MSQPLPQSIQQWLNTLDATGKSIHTQQAYVRGLRHFLHWYMSVYEADFKVETVMARDIRDWQARLPIAIWGKFTVETQSSSKAPIEQQFMGRKRTLYSRKMLDKNPSYLPSF